MCRCSNVISEILDFGATVVLGITKSVDCRGLKTKLKILICYVSTIFIYVLLKHG